MGNTVAGADNLTFTSLSFEGMSKRYGAAFALDDVSITLTAGRVHALMGENGAGKSTFIKLIAGVVPADRMAIFRDGAPVAVSNPAMAHAAGFRFIHQELNVVRSLSVAENILLGHPPPHRLGLFVDWKALARRAEAALHALGIDHIDVGRHAGSLTTGDQMLIKIAAALVADRDKTSPCLYVLDEPTAALNDQESEKLFTVIDGLKSCGAAILYVSHRLGEVMRICDDVTVLRNGRLVSSGPIDGTSREGIIQDMTGRPVSDSYPNRRSDIGDAVVCVADNVSSNNLQNISFRLNAGEVLGITGLAGAGQTDLLHLFLGLEKPTGGAVLLLGTAAPESPVAAWARRVAYVPAERRTQGLMMRMGVRPNMLLPHYAGLRARRSAEVESVKAVGASVGLKAEGPEQSVWQLSGGNQQKVVFARALMEDPSLLLLDEPTRGVDVGAKFEIYELIRSLSGRGCAVLLSSTDLPELIGMCDRILVLSEGTATAMLKPDNLRPSDLLAAFYRSDQSPEVA